MQDHTLHVGEELVIGGHVHLTILAVEASKVVFGIAAEPKDGRRRQFLQNGPSLAGAVLIVEDDFIQRALLKCLLFAGLRVGTLLRVRPIVGCACVRAAMVLLRWR